MSTDLQYPETEECYACMVGVATGPESHDPSCPARGVTFSPDGLTVIRKDATKHRVHTSYEDERAHWECSCGAAGSCREYDADIASDKHIDYAAGEGRVDTSRAF